jgi:hypothetical protein
LNRRRVASGCARFLKGGSDALADCERLELVLFGALPRRDVKPLAKDLIARFGSFAEVASAPPEPSSILINDHRPPRLTAADAHPPRHPMPFPLCGRRHILTPEGWTSRALRSDR